MTFTKLKFLDVGDAVRWYDPEKPSCNGSYRIMEIITESGLIESEESVMVLADDDGHCSEVFASELA